jgi:AGCS family alanine or glycine:cation symporter
MEVLKTIVDTLNTYIWEKPEVVPFMILLLLGYGLFITVRLGLIQVRKFSHGVKVVMGYYDNPDDAGDVNHFQALSTALSATVGIGNIAGVAIAIHYGGPGALFWMWITALLGMAVKYSECTLAVHYRNINADGSVSGGPMYYIEKGLGPNWKWLAVVFASSAVICSFLTGNAVQANTVADTLESTFSIPVLATAFITSALVGFVIIGGIKRIGAVASMLAPLMAAIYVVSGIIILMLNYDMILPTFGLIFESAFNPTAGAVGVGTGSLLTTMIWGVKRGLFSNEAGQGSAPIAHAAAKTDEPVREGVVALLEPFIDTILICTMTGLVLLSTGSWNKKHEMSLAFNSNGLAYAFAESGQKAGDLIVQNGVITNGSVKLYDTIDTLYADKSFTAPFNGMISVSGSSIRATDAQGASAGSFYAKTYENGAPVTALAFEIGLSSLFSGGRYIVTLCVFLFAISTAISWFYYGDRATQYLFGDRGIHVYKWFYIAAHFTGSIVTLTTIWAIGDIALGLMTIPNIFALFLLSGVTVKLTNDYFSRPHERPQD